MYRYLVIICSVFVLVGCAGSPSVQPDEQIDNPSSDGSLLGSDNTSDDENGVIDEGSGDDDASTTVTATDDDENSPVQVRVLKTKYEVSLFSDVDIKLSAKGGTGSYTWSADWLPTGLSLQDQDGKQIFIRGRASVIGSFTGKIEVCDAANSANCDDKEIKIIINDSRTGVAVPFLQTDCMGSLKIVENVRPGYDALKEDEPNRRPPHYPFAATFGVHGGKGPFIWSIAAKTEEGLPSGAWTKVVSSDGRKVDVSSSLDNYIVSCVKLTGAKERLPFPSAECAGERTFEESIVISVKDESCHIASTKTFDFNLEPDDAQKLKNIKILVGLDADDTARYTNILIQLYNKEDKEIARLHPYVINQNGSQVQPKGFYGNVSSLDRYLDVSGEENPYFTWAQIQVLKQYANVEPTEIVRAKLHLDDRCCGDYFDVTPTKLVIFNNFWFLVSENSSRTNVEVGDSRRTDWHFFTAEYFSKDSSDPMRVEWQNCGSYGGGWYGDAQICGDMNQDPIAPWVRWLDEN